MWWIAAAIVLGLLAWVLLVAPGCADKKKRAPFSGRAYAHRGLYEADQSVPENSLEAFCRAAEAGYGIELDVQLSRDGQIVVFHDDTLTRVCGVEARVDAYPYAELREMPLCGTAHHMPLFSEVLAAVGGRVPLIVELKAGGRQALLCEKTRDMLAAYKGPYCIESFHPVIVWWFRKHAPEVLRGQLSEAWRSSRSYIGNVEAFCMSRLLTNVITRPQFIAYGIGKKCMSARLSEALGAMRVAWTAHEPELHEKRMRTNDAVIFEHYRPACGRAAGVVKYPDGTDREND